MHCSSVQVSVGLSRPEMVNRTSPLKISPHYDQDNSLIILVSVITSNNLNAGKLAF
jgi:hypothetical protein